MNVFRKFKVLSLIALLALLADLPAMPLVMCDTEGEVLLEEFHIGHDQHHCEQHQGSCSVTPTEKCEDILVVNDSYLTKKVKAPLLFTLFILFLPLILTHLSLLWEHFRRIFYQKMPILSNYYPLTTVMRN